MKYIYKTLFLTFFFTLLLSSCKKKIIETIPVIDYEDVSLNESADIKSFSFPTLLTGYAAANNLFKTIDGGHSWTKLNFAGSIKSIEFVDENTGFCTSDGYLYRTINGGQTWVLLVSADYVAIAQSGQIVIAKETTFIGNIKVSNNNGNTFYASQTLSLNGHLSGLRVFDNTAYITDTKSYSDDVIRGVNIADSNKTVRLEAKATADENPNDLYYVGGNGAVVGGRGLICNSSGSGNPYYIASFDRSYYGHTYTYNSIDGYDGLMVAVGYHTIASNIDIKNKETWNEVFNKDRNGFEQTFFRIRFFNKTTFFVSGNNGLIWKVKI
jgi:hypothetical protein